MTNPALRTTELLVGMKLDEVDDLLVELMTLLLQVSADFPGDDGEKPRHLLSAVIVCQSLLRHVAAT